jgi:hypothetical protein
LHNFVFVASTQANGIRFQPYKFFGGLDARRGSKSLEGDFPALAALATARRVSLHALAARWALQRWSCVEHVLGCSTMVRCGGCYQCRSESNSSCVAF